MNEAGVGDAPRRRLRPGPGLAVGRRCRRRRPGRACPRHVRAHPAGRPPAWPATGLTWWPPTFARPASGLVARNAHTLELPADRLSCVVGRRHRAAVPARNVRQGAARRSLLGTRRPASPPRRPVAHRPRRSSITLAELQRRLLDAVRDPRATRAASSSTACARSPRSRPSRSTTGSSAAHPELVALDAARRAVAAVRSRRAAAAPGGGHRRHVPAPPPTGRGRLTDMTDHAHRSHHEHAPTDHAATTTPADGLEAKVLTVSDGVVAGTRDDRSGRGARRTAGRRGVRRRRAPGRRRRPRHGGRGDRRDGRGLHRRDRHHRGHRVRSPRPHPRGHQGRPRPRGARASPRPCGW